MAAKIKIDHHTQIEISDGEQAELANGHLVVYTHGKHRVLAVFAPGKWEHITFTEVTEATRKNKVAVL